MKLDLEELPVGPLRKGKLKLDADITVIFGKPNSGKSYLLRTLHSLNFCSDVDAITTFLSNLYVRIIKSSTDVKVLEITKNGIKFVIKNLRKILGLSVLDSFVATYSKALPRELLKEVYGRTCLLKALRPEALEVNMIIKIPIKKKVISDFQSLNVSLADLVDLLWKTVEVKIVSKVVGDDVVVVVKALQKGVEEINWDESLGVASKAYLVGVWSGVANEVMKGAKNELVFVPHDKYSLGTLWNFASRLCDHLTPSGEFDVVSISVAKDVDSFWKNVLELGAHYASFWLKVERAFCVASGSEVNTELWERFKKLNEVFGSVLEGSLGVDRSGLKYRYGSLELPTYLSSGLANEVGFLVLALSSLSEGSTTLLEEPETQLHPKAQVGLALALAKASEELNFKFVVVTHSPYVMLTLALTSLNVGAANELARSVGYDKELRERRNVRVYEAKDGELRELSPEEIAYEIPSIFEVDVALTKALNEA